MTTKLELTQDELQALLGLLHAGVQSLGLRAVKDAAKLIEKIEAAQTDHERVTNGEPRGQ